MIRLQRCVDCGAAQYPPREFCGACLSAHIACETADVLPGRVLGVTRLHHSNEPSFRRRLPLRIGLVQFASGPVAVCFLAEAAVAGDAVDLRIGDDGTLVGSLVAGGGVTRRRRS